MCIEPPLPPHSPACLGEQLLHHHDEVAALGDAVAVPAMGAGDVILRAEMLAHADGGGLLAGIEMHKTGNAALRELVLHPFLELADRRHAAIGVEQFLAVQLHGVLPIARLAGKESIVEVRDPVAKREVRRCGRPVTENLILQRICRRRASRPGPQIGHVG